MENKYTTKKPICPICDKPMHCYDIDYMFNGCQDNYWECDCGMEARNKVRYGKQLGFKLLYDGIYEKEVNNNGK